MKCFWKHTWILYLCQNQELHHLHHLQRHHWKRHLHKSMLINIDLTNIFEPWTLSKKKDVQFMKINLFDWGKTLGYMFFKVTCGIIRTNITSSSILVCSIRIIWFWKVRILSIALISIFKSCMFHYWLKQDRKLRYNLSLRTPLAASGPTSLVVASLFVASASFDSEKQGSQ